MSVYKEKDYVDAVTESGDEVKIPKAWVGTEYAVGYSVEGKSSRGSSSKADPVEVPEGDPEEAWTGKQLDAYAEREGIDLGGASTKADKVAAIELAKEEAATATVTGD